MFPSVCSILPYNKPLCNEDTEIANGILRYENDPDIMTTVTVISRNNKHPLTFCRNCTTNVASTMAIVAALISSEIAIKRLKDLTLATWHLPQQPIPALPQTPNSTTFSTLMKLFFLTYISRLINILETAVRL